MVRLLSALMILVLFHGVAPGEEVLLQAGFGERDITPKVDEKKPVWIAGFGHNRRAKGVNDPLMARAIVLRHGEAKIALASVDLVGFFNIHSLNVRKALPAYAYVLISSTHNHEGPDTLGLWGPSAFESGVDREYLALVEKEVVEAIRLAEKALQPVTVRMGKVHAPELLRDGREPEVKQDDLITLDFRDASGEKSVGLVVNWHCHPETLDDKNTLLSADFVGYTVGALRKKHNCPVVYFTGTVGGLLTSLKVEVRDAEGNLLEDGTFEKTARYGELVAAAAERALADGKPIQLAPFKVKQKPIFLPVDNKYYELGWRLGVLDRELFIWKGDINHAQPANKQEGLPRLAIQTEIAWLGLGELEVAAIPGEIYPELVLSKVQAPADPGADFPDAPVEPGVYEQLRSPQRMLIGLANDEVGYIIPRRQWDEKPPYCYGRRKAQYGEINSLGPETAPLLLGAFKELVGGK
jgi:hypothetical protein